MKKLLLWSALFFAFLGGLGHFYLAKRAYQLKAGLAGESAICHINESINCDQALLSPYSRIGEMSISSFGFAIHVFMFILLLALLFKISLSLYWKNLLFYSSLVVAMASVGMAVLSLTQSLYCPVCWGLYLISFVFLLCVFLIFKTDLSRPWKFVLQALKEKSSYFSMAGILIISFFIHASFINAYNLKDQKQLITASLIDWQSEEEFDFSEHFLMRKGTGDIVLVEFADFLCPNCERVQPALEKFLSAFSNIEFRFFVYPLDSVCNPQVAFTRNGLSCELSKALVCAKDRAWDFHDFFFERQKEFILSDDKKTQELFDEALAQTGLEKSAFKACMKDPETLEKVKLSAQAGAKAEIRGTPTFFINGKEVRHSSPKLLIFYKIYEQIQKGLF